MLDALVSRSRFYDMLGYWIPGNVVLGIIWVFLKVIFCESLAEHILTCVSANLAVSVIVIFIVSGYVLGHLANSFSKLLIENFMLKGIIRNRFDWYGRIKSEDSDRCKIIESRFKNEFGYRLSGDTADSILIQEWSAQKIPAVSMTTTRYLCFYGMNRTLGMLTLLIMLPTVPWVFLRSGRVCGISYSLACIGMVGLFLFQYLRFAKAYADRLPIMLLVGTRKPSLA